MRTSGCLFSQGLGHVLAQFAVATLLNNSGARFCEPRSTELRTERQYAIRLERQTV